MQKRNLLLSAAALALMATTTGAWAQAQGKLKVGFMLPATGTFASLGTAIDNGFRLYVAEQGGKIAGREVEYVRVDDESDPSKATDNVNKLIKRDNVDVIVGTVHSGVAMAMAKAAKESGTLLIVPNAGAAAVTGPMCAPNIFRSSFSNWQPGYAMGEVAAKKGHKKIVTITWKYAAGDESVKGFKDGFEKSGGTVIKELSLPFPNVEFQALLTEIAALKPDAVFTFFAGGGAVKFVKDYSTNVLKAPRNAFVDAKGRIMAFFDQVRVNDDETLAGDVGVDIYKPYLQRIEAPVPFVPVLYDVRKLDDIALYAAGHAELIQKRTGLVIDAYFSATKIAWMLEQVPGDAPILRLIFLDICKSGNTIAMP